jgi:hypothetical protein
MVAIFRAVALMATALPARAANRLYKAPGALSLFPIAGTASRNCAAARLDDLGVLDERIFPPGILLPGARHSHEVKCLEVGQRGKSVQHSAIRFKANEGPIP